MRPTQIPQISNNGFLNDRDEMAVYFEIHVYFPCLESGLDETIYIDNRIMADAFDEEIKNKYLAASDLGQEAEIIIENNRYLLMHQAFDKTATRLKKTT
ncbi:unnamed protein product [Rotaria sordida]|uniref:Uncharacterized protein n=1 Tax=Rotaria sordida TaxID=392033 RepID=A0A814WLQ2_9BILA|nr:unnamed protein product [Rotaria sordida]